MKRHPRVVAAVVVIATITVVSACAPEEAPKPTPTAAFASDEEAFAAAEETYRAYVDALNQVDLSDPDTFEPVYALTTGDVNATEREQLTNAHADGWTVSGDTVVLNVQPLTHRPDEHVSIVVCIDVSDVALLDAEGNSRVSPTRADQSSREISMVPASTSTTWAIDAVAEPETEACSS